MNCLEFVPPYSSTPGAEPHAKGQPQSFCASRWVQAFFFGGMKMKYYVYGFNVLTGVRAK